MISKMNKIRLIGSPVPHLAPKKVNEKTNKVACFIISNMPSCPSNSKQKSKVLFILLLVPERTMRALTLV